MTSTRGGYARITAALTIVIVMIAAGGLHRSPWVVALATPAFTVLYALGKWNAWMAAWRAGGLKQIVAATMVTLPIQAVLAGVLYLLGLGLGRLVGGYRPLAALSAGDVVAAVVLFGIGVALSAVVIRAEKVPPEPAAPTSTTEEPEVDVDPNPLTVDTFFVSPGYWRVNAARTALEKRGETVVRPPLAAREDMIAAAEQRLGVRLPDTLRTLYGVCNGGYVDWLYVPLKADPQPVYDDWRGAFSIDYSQLAPVETLRTVTEHYHDFTDDPDEIPAGADQQIILQARYGDMTLLDYSHGPAPRVLIVDYDKYGGDPVDIAFDDFDTFFAALRRDRTRSRDTAPTRPLGAPLGEAAQEHRARRFWGAGSQHPFHANAGTAEHGADDDLVAATHARLEVTLPAGLITLWRAKNGGGVASRFVGTADDRTEVMRFPVPLEYIVSLATLSDRIEFPSGETPWRQRHPGSDRLMVLEADHDRAVLLDYRDGPDPAVLAVTDLGRPLTEASRFEDWDALAVQLRFQLGGWDDVAAPHADDL